MCRTRLDLLSEWLSWLTVAGSIALRLRQYAVDRSLWLDEAMLVNNVLGRDWLPLRLRSMVVLGLLLAAGADGVVHGVSRNLEPRYIAELRPVMEQLRYHLQAGDVIWVASETRPVFEYHTRRLAWFPPVLSGRRGYPDAAIYPAALARVLPEHPRVWLLCATEVEVLGRSRFQYDIIPACERAGPLCDLLTAHDALAACFRNPAWPVKR